MSSCVCVAQEEYELHTNVESGFGSFALLLFGLDDGNANRANGPRKQQPNMTCIICDILGIFND